MRSPDACARRPARDDPWMDSLVRVLATFFGTGHFPFAPATFASLVFGVVAFALPTPSDGAWIAATLLVTLVGIQLSSRAERFYGHDGSPIVIDEVAGMMVTLAMIPKDPLWLWPVGFLAFRAFDIVKPFPAGRAQELPRGFGVMLDDVVAGVYAHLVVRIAMRLWT